MKFIVKRKLYTVYDDTDNLKRMKDSDILAEKYRQPTVSPGAVAGSAVAGAALGGLGGSVVGAFTKKKKPGTGVLSKMGRGGKKGLLFGGLAAGGLAMLNRTHQSKENQFYNDRLAYAKRQAQRREKADWKQNMTQRQGYSY